MYTKEFTNFVWEEKWIVLDMPYFYFRKYSFPKCWSFNCNFMLYIFSLFHPGPWQWCITHSFHLGAIICKISWLKRVWYFGTFEGFWGELLEVLGEGLQKVPKHHLSRFINYYYISYMFLSSPYSTLHFTLTNMNVEINVLR